MTSLEQTLVWNGEKLYEEVDQHNLGVLKYRLNSKDENMRSLFYNEVIGGTRYETDTDLEMNIKLVNKYFELSESQRAELQKYIDKAHDYNQRYRNAIDAIRKEFGEFADDRAAINTLENRIRLECWQGRLNVGHGSNPEKHFEYI